MRDITARWKYLSQVMKLHQPEAEQVRGRRGVSSTSPSLSLCFSSSAVGATHYYFQRIAPDTGEVHRESVGSGVLHCLVPVTGLELGTSSQRLPALTPGLDLPGPQRAEATHTCKVLSGG